MAEEISRRSGFDSVSTWWMMDVNSCVDGGSDIVMAEDRESESDAVTEETEVADEPEFEFESTVSTTVAMLEPARDAPLPDDPSSHRFAPRPVMRHLPGLIEDDISDDRKTPDEFAINPSDDALSNPQNGSDSLGLDHVDLEHSGDADGGNEDGGDGGGDGGDGDNGHADSASDGSSQSWEAAWNSVPSSNQNNWSVPLPAFPDNPGPPVPLVDPHVIRVVFRYEMLVEMRFNPGLRAGPPQTRILARHMSHVSTNF